MGAIKVGKGAEQEKPVQHPFLLPADEQMQFSMLYWLTGGKRDEDIRLLQRQI